MLCQVTSVVSDSVWPHGLQPTRLLHPWDFPGKSTGMGCHCLLQLTSPNTQFFFNWNILGLQCCVSFRCAAKWFSYTCICVCLCVPSCSVVSDSLNPWAVTTRLLCAWDSSGKSTGVGCHFLLQGIFPTQGLNSGLWHCMWIIYLLNHQGSWIPTYISIFF